MQFNYDFMRRREAFAQRSVTMAPKAMVASSQQLATLAGYKILAKGGNAVDAAVAMVATLNVVEPHSVGIGGDAFALIKLAGEDKVIGMNASGRAPAKADIAWFRQQGMTEMPGNGILTVTVPGALMGWAEAVEKYGRLSLGEVFADAIHYARDGFPVTEVISGEWRNAQAKLETQPSAAAYLVDGKAPMPGQVFKNPGLARTFETIAEQGVGAFYGGSIGQAIASFAKDNGGLLTVEDLERHTTSWVEPIASDYRGYTVVELPPNGQGLVALEMLNIMEGYDVRGMGHNSPEYIHRLMEAKKIAFRDRARYITDPQFSDIPVEHLLSPEYAEECRGLIDPERAKPLSAQPPLPQGSETVYVCAVDQDRNAVSFISSIYEHFGSVMVVPETGIVLQNRGCSFSLDPSHPNRIEPGKRTMHTIIPAMLFKEDRFLMSFGVMGGDMQPQGHTQFLVNLIDFDMNLQEAVDAPRARHMKDMEIYLEDGITQETAEVLSGMGHQVTRQAAVNAVGGGQAIFLDREQDTLLGASDRRKDGMALGY